MKIITKNKSAYFDYDIEERFNAGIVLLGHEVKSIKKGHVNIKDSIVKIHNNEIYISNMDVPLYDKTSPNIAKGYEQKGIRKLLLKRKEIDRLIQKTNKTGLAIVPLQVILDIRRLIKIEIGLGKLRKKIEKKQIIKERDIQKQARKEIKSLKIG